MLYSLMAFTRVCLFSFVSVYKKCFSPVGVRQSRHSSVPVEVGGDLQRGGRHSAAGELVLGGDGGAL